MASLEAKSSGVNYDLDNEKHQIHNPSDADTNTRESKEAYDGKGADDVSVQKGYTFDSASDSVEQVFDTESIDPVLAKKMELVNKAIDDIGMTSFHWKMFCLNGFGYAVDSVRYLKLPDPSAHVNIRLSSYSSSASPLPIPLCSGSMGVQAPRSLVFRWPRRLASLWAPAYGASLPTSSAASLHSTLASSPAQYLF